MRPAVLVLACCVLAGCPNVDSIGYQRPRVDMITRDLATGFDVPPTDWYATHARADWTDRSCDPGGLTIELPFMFQLPRVDGYPNIPDASERAALDAALRAGLSLIRVDDGTIVPTEVRDGCFDVAGERSGDATSLALSLVPTAPLEDGWYLFRADLSEVRAMGFDVQLGEPREGDVRYARVRWGSAPTWGAATLECRGVPLDRCVVDALVSEEVDPAVLEAATLRVAYAGVEAECTVGRWSGGLQASCPPPPEGADVAITLESDTITAPSGAPAGTVVVPHAEAALPHTAPLWVMVEPDFAIDLVRDGGR